MPGPLWTCAGAADLAPPCLTRELPASRPARPQACSRARGALRRGRARCRASCSGCSSASRSSACRRCCGTSRTRPSTCRRELRSGAARERRGQLGAAAAGQPGCQDAAAAASTHGSQHPRGSRSSVDACRCRQGHSCPHLATGGVPAVRGRAAGAALAAVDGAGAWVGAAAAPAVARRGCGPAGARRGAACLLTHRPRLPARRIARSWSTRSCAKSMR